MKVLLLNGTRGERPDPTAELISKICRQKLTKNQHTIEEIKLCEKKITECVGCFGCWVKTPGICVIPDESREMARSVINSDLLITLSRSEEHTSELQSRPHLVCRLLLEKK